MMGVPLRILLACFEGKGYIENDIDPVSRTHSKLAQLRGEVSVE